MRGVNPGGA